MEKVLQKQQVPFFRVELGDQEIAEVVESLRSGWLTTGPKVKRFEEEFASAVGAKHAIALNSCTAALHLGLEAIHLQRGELVLVPTYTFAATAEVVRYFDAIPVFVDCGADSNIDPEALESTLKAIGDGKPVAGLTPPYGRVRAIIPMHYAGYSCEMDRIAEIAVKYGVDLIEDAAHAFPASYRRNPGESWLPAGRFSKVGCYSFYANKCITTGEGGMAITDDDEIAARMRLMSLHGMSRDAWKRFTSEGSWYYEIVAPGFKYNMTDVAAAIGIHQLRRAEELRRTRESIAVKFNAALSHLAAIELPAFDPDTRMHSWHLYSIRLHLDRLSIDRARFIDELKLRGVICSVHWMPLHMNPYYRQVYGLGEGLFPRAESMWPRQVSLPLFPAMTEAEIDYVIAMVEEVAQVFGTD